MVFTNEIRPLYRYFERSEKSFLQTDKRCVCESRDEVPQVTSDLNTTFEHRHYLYCGEAATTTLNPQP